MARAVTWNAAAKWITQLLSWVSTVLVARLLAPSDYGLVGMAGIYLNLASLVGEAGIGNAVVVLRDLTQAQIAELNSLSLVLGASLVGLSCVLAFPLARFFSAPQLSAVIVVTSLMYVVNGLQVVPRALLQRDLQFKLLASIEMARAFCQIVSTLLFAWLNFRYWSLVLGQIVACIVNTFLILYWKKHDFAVPRLSALKRELTFSRQLLISGVAWYAYDNADFGVAGRVLGETALGNYTVAWTISSAPVEKITNLITSVTPAFFSAVQNNKAELRRYFLRLSEVLSLVTIPASAGIALVADYFVPALLGPKWLGVIGPLRLLSIFFAVRSIGTILSNLLYAIGDSRFVMWTTIVAAAGMPLAFFIGSRWGTNGIAAAWVVAYPPIMLPLYYRVFQKTGLKAKEYLSVLIPALSASALMTIAVLFARLVLPVDSHALVRLVAIAFVGATFYVGSLLLLHKERVMQVSRAIWNVRK